MRQLLVFCKLLTEQRVIFNICKQEIQLVRQTDLKLKEYQNLAISVIIQTHRTMRDNCKPQI